VRGDNEHRGIFVPPNFTNEIWRLNKLVYRKKKGNYNTLTVTIAIKRKERLFDK